MGERGREGRERRGEGGKGSERGEEERGGKIGEKRNMTVCMTQDDSLKSQRVICVHVGKCNSVCNMHVHVH